MTVTLLLDLDNTLLGNEIDHFLPVYLQRLSQNFPQWRPEEFIKKLLNATQAMVKKNSPRQTLEECFDEVFYPSLRVEKKDLIADLTAFYANEFPKLQPTTQLRPAAKVLVEQAFSAGYQVVVATNPIFPRAAIEHRLAWAGLPVERYPFDLVTSFERLHFSKPHPAYYAEMFAQLGCPENPVLMVGDSLQEDLIPSAQLGIPGFLIRTPGQEPPAGIPAGGLEDVWDWIQATLLENRQVNPAASQAAILATLKSIPAAFDSLCRDLSPAQWRFRPAAQDWSTTEILCHLRDVDGEVNLPRLQRIAAEEAPFVAGIPTDPWAEERDYFHQSGPAALAAFIDTRTQMTGLLDLLSDAGWQRTARHAIFGPTTLEELVRFTTTHDIVHMRQGAQTIQGARGQ